MTQENIEFIGHDGHHYKIIKNRIYKIKHRVLRRYYKDECKKLLLLKRNCYYPFTKNYERSNNIMPIQIEIMKNYPNHFNCFNCFNCFLFRRSHIIYI